MPDEPIFLQTPDPAALDRETLKERSATALERGLAFVDRHGSDDERSLARVVLEAQPVDLWVADLEARQHEDGTWSPTGCDLVEALGFEDPARWGAATAGTLEALSWLAGLGAIHVPAAQRAEAWLRAHQNPDGSFGEASGEAADRLYPTAMLAGILGRSDYVRPVVLEGAGAFLTPLWSPEAVEEGRWSTIAAFSCFFSNVAHDLSDEALQWCGRELERGFRTEHFDAVLTARVLLWCDAPSLPGARLSGDEVARALVAQQEDDGGWPAPPERRVARAWDGLVALLKLGASGA